jgi:hypothetical protein
VRTRLSWTTPDPLGWALINFGPYASPADVGPPSTPNASFSFVSSPIILPAQATDIAIAIAITTGGSSPTTPTGYTRDVDLINSVLNTFDVDNKCRTAQNDCGADCVGQSSVAPVLCMKMLMIGA